MTEKIKVGDKVRVLSNDGSTQYTDYIGQVLIVSKVRDPLKGVEDQRQMINCFCPYNGEEIESGMYSTRFEKVTEFGLSSLKAGMRVKHANGQTFMVVFNSRGDKVFAKVGGFNLLSYWNEDFTFKATDKQWGIVEVFDLPTYDGGLLDLGAISASLWKKPVVVKTDLTPYKDAVAEAAATVVQATAALEAAKVALEAAQK